MLVTLNQGETLMAKGITEIVVISGDSTALITASANVQAGEGLIDITDGNVVINGALVKPNHQIIIPKADGRGIIATSGSVSLLVRGEYTVAN